MTTLAPLVTPHERALALDRDLPQTLAGALDFGTSDHYMNQPWVIRTLRSFERKNGDHLLTPLYETVDRLAQPAGYNLGRTRMPGRFELAYLAFVFSKLGDVKPWWSRTQSSVWKLAGFKERPSYKLVQLRFSELEHPDVMAAMEQVASQLIQAAVAASGGQVGRFLHVDSTEAETHARLKHVCPADKACWRDRDAWRSDQRVSAQASSAYVRAERQLNAQAPEEGVAPDTDTEIGEASRIERKEGSLLVKVGSCWYQVLDPTAGVRAYTRGGKLKRFWVGFYNAKAIDHYTGAPVAVRITSASTNEFITYPSLFQAAYENLGQRLPRAVVGDRGYSISYVFEHNTKLGVGSVFPWRQFRGDRPREKEDTDTHDRHGIVRCKYCGAPTRMLSFAKSAGAGRGPRLYVQCSVPVTPDCKKRQSIACATSWRMLLPLWRDTPVYLALRYSHDRYERVHHHWRSRWLSGADDDSQRPKRRGLPNQQLRANAALLLEWLMICERERWLPGQRPRGKPHPERILVDDGARFGKELREYRKDVGLDRPYGPKAVELGIGGLTPKSLPPSILPEDPAEPEEAPVVLPDLPGEPSDNGDGASEAAELDDLQL
jgi:hypothetical protein